MQQFLRLPKLPFSCRGPRMFVHACTGSPALPGAEAYITCPCLAANRSCFSAIRLQWRRQWHLRQVVTVAAGSRWPGSMWQTCLAASSIACERVGLIVIGRGSWGPGCTRNAAEQISNWASQFGCRAYTRTASPRAPTPLQLVACCRHDNADRSILASTQPHGHGSLVAQKGARSAKTGTHTAAPSQHPALSQTMLVTLRYRTTDRDDGVPIWMSCPADTACS
jgi:hypothetical protein